MMVTIKKKISRAHFFVMIPSPLSFAQSRRHDKYPPQPFLQRNGFFRAKVRADPAAQAGVFISLSHVLCIKHNGIGGTPFNAGPAAGAGLLIDQRKMVGGVDHRQGAAAPQLQCITAILSAVADAGFGAVFPGTRVKGLVDQPGVFGFFHNLQSFCFGDFLGKSLGRRVARGFAEGKAV
jgi:hypothetical protein